LKASYVINNVMKMNILLSFSSPPPPGRRLGGTYESALERICADCQEKTAHFGTVHIKNSNFCKHST
jgi:hypothetical protein